MTVDFHHRLASVASEIEDVLVTIFDVATTPPVPARLLRTGSSMESQDGFLKEMV